MAVRRGFHRIGLAIAVPLGVVALGALAFAAYRAITLPPPSAVQAYAPPNYESQYFQEPTSLREIADTLSKKYNRTVSELDLRVYPLREPAIEEVYAGLGVAAACVILGLFGYLISWVLGWIIAGFKSETT